MNKPLIYTDFVTQHITKPEGCYFLSQKKRKRFLSALVQLLNPEKLKIYSSERKSDNNDRDASKKYTQSPYMLKVTEGTIITNHKTNPCIFDTERIKTVTDHHNTRHKIYWINYANADGKVIDEIQKEILNFVSTESVDAAVIILTGIRCNDELFQLWKTLASNSIVKISLDCYYDGILFFKEGIAKQDFAIRI